MAAAEARAAWQRAANRCLVQEDRKRAPKLACCPSASEQHHGINNGNCVNSEDRPISNFMPLSCNPMNSNLPLDIRWWLQSQPNFGVQKDIVSEDHKKKMENSAPKPKHEEPLVCETVGTHVEKGADVFEPPWMVSASVTKYSLERSLEEFKTVDGLSQEPLKCRGTVRNCFYEDNELLNFKSSDPPPLKNQQKANSDMDAPWKEIEKTQPWWQITDENELASLVAERAIQHIENCDLPRPTQKVRVHGTESQSHGDLRHSGGPSSPAGRVSHPGFSGQHEHIDCSYSSESTDGSSLSNNRCWQQHDRNFTYSPAQDFSNSSSTGSESKQTFPNASERDQILEALRHSQTRAREAEMAARKASNEKDDVINLLLRQASHLFACNQWLKILQLENIGLQLKHKEDQIATMIPELPWMSSKEKPTPDQEQKDWSRRKGRRQKKEGSFFDAILFAVGLGLAGAGFLLGWTLGWLLPKL
ncbi:hypothetical protein EJB05_49423 [Eragrostis curvula]|uniref:Uncharacterized protein n=1 Tax=Eragrostis curvula TaxID=38414 RepID=A0A5J9T450_9POAL|nr:hypothetical protein EJB05_49365 [Eragrostis curvula]TVU06222.1 hypothetical protein EJB05_49423 [Eragrostis curvula]